MGLFDLYSAQAGTNEPAVQALPRTLGERVEATAAATFAPDRYFTINAARGEMWQRATDDLHRATGQVLPNPYGAIDPAEMLRLGNQPAIIAERSNKIIQAAQMARAQGHDDLFNPENIDRYIGEESARRRQTAASYEGAGSGFLNFLAGAGLETVTPHGLVSLMMPVTRLPVAAASSVGSTFLGNVLREGAFQGVANMGIQAAAEGLDFTSRREVGTGQHLGEVLASIGGAGALGFAIGGGVRALHLKWLGLPEQVRANAPQEVKDAFRIIEADVLYSARNRLGVDPLLHERYQGMAADAVLRGRPVDLSTLAGAGDTPLTGLAGVLPAAPDGIRPRISGMGSVVERVRALPDGELEAVARELKPRSFIARDRITSEIEAAERELAAMRAESERIGIADVVDPDSGLRLQAIEQDLQAPALSRRDRTRLEQERDTITASLDRQGTLDSEIAAARRTVETPAEAARRAALEEKIAALQKELPTAHGEAQREIDYLRAKLDNLASRILRGGEEVTPEALAREMGAAPAALATAVSRADFARQVRLLRESGDRTPTPVFDTTTRPPMPPAERQRALDAETKRLMDQWKPGITAHHGSPHLFDRFDPKKIGTGEGSQMEAIGHYFSADPSVAKPSGYVAPMKLNQGATGQRHTGPGYGYEVDLKIDPEHLIKWDKSVSEQPEAALKLMRELGLDKEQFAASTAKQEMQKLLGQAVDEAPVLVSVRKPPETGESLYRQIVDKLMADRGIDQSAAVRLMNDAGVPGVTYTAGDGKRQFVVFHGAEDRIKIVRRTQADTGAEIPLPGSRPSRVTEAAMRELDEADTEVRDAKAAMTCVMGGGGIP